MRLAEHAKSTFGHRASLCAQSLVIHRKIRGSEVALDHRQIGKSSAFSTEPIKGVKVINVDDAIHYQHMAAFSAAMTDSSAWLLWDQLSPAARAVLMSQLFGPEGIHLNFIRVPIGASDYTVGGTPYSYDDLPAGQSDPTLANFSIAHDEPYIIPSLLQALRVNPSTQILASPWSPPAWMKANDAFNNIDLSGALLPAYYEPFADYLVKFIEAYRAQGIPISAITPENEPTLARPTRACT